MINKTLELPMDCSLGDDRAKHLMYVIIYNRLTNLIKTNFDER